MDDKSKRNITVLLVDDQQRILRFLSIALKTSGYRVITAETGEKALNLARLDKPDIVVLDIFLPGIDGFEVLLKLRAFSQAPVIMISARDSLGPNALNQGADDFLAKPFKPEQLVQRIKDILDKTNVKAGPQSVVLPPVVPGSAGMAKKKVEPLPG